MTPLERYRRDIEIAGHAKDPAQEIVVRQAEKLWQKWAGRKPDNRGYFSKLFFPEPYIQGLYIWGGVGRGKTYILDLLYCSLPTERKKRVHFHQFMQDIHKAMQALHGVANPLQQIAIQTRESIDILFVDEFHVNDIADAMLLTGLLDSLFEQGITLVTTSNIPVNDLYHEGLQRERFLPAIDLLNKHTQVIELAQGADYRKQAISRTEQIESAKIRQQLKQRGVNAHDFDKLLTINKRELFAHVATDTLVWFDFDEICNTPRSAADYLLLAKQYDELIVTDIPVFTESNEDAAQRFIHLIDALYDQRVKLVYTVNVSLGELYQGRLLKMPFLRTTSRLTEMNSDKYASESKAFSEPPVSDSASSH